MFKISGQRDFVLYPLYTDIAFEHFLLCELKMNEINKLINGDHIFKVVMSERAYDYDIMTKEFFREYSIVTVFSALAIETYAYDLGVALFDENYMQKIEKLPIYEKWRIILEKGLAYKLKDDSKLDKLLSKLISTRRKLVHAKSKDHLFPENSNEANDFWQIFLKENEEMIALAEIDDLLEYLKEIIKDKGRGRELPLPIVFNEIDKSKY